MTETVLCPNCSFCGAQFPGNPAALRGHIFECEAHPAARQHVTLKAMLQAPYDQPVGAWFGAIYAAFTAAEECIKKAHHSA